MSGFCVACNSIDYDPACDTCMAAVYMVNMVLDEEEESGTSETLESLDSPLETESD